MSKISPVLLSRCVADVFVNENIKEYIDPIKNDPNITIKQIIALIEKEESELCVIKIILDFTDLTGSNHEVPNALITYTWNKKSKHIQYINTNSKTTPPRSITIGKFFNT